MGWMLRKKNHKVHEARGKLDLSDLTNDPVVAFSQKLDPFFQLFMCFIFPTLVSSYGWNENVIPSYLVEGCLRNCIVLHATFLVNSAAHIYGYRPNDKSTHATENRLVAVITGGEGWHNWHHAFPYDYAASEFGAEHQYNTTKVFIDACAWVGLVTERKRALNAWENMKLKNMKL